MSRYETYQVTSKNYDKTRVPVGVEVILGTFATCGVPLSDQRILDAGCGTGNYIAALRGHVGRIIGLDGNAGMLSEAKKKFIENDRVELSQGQLPELPFPDASFNGVTCNQVVHHFDPAGDYSQLRALIRECRRVLKPGGALIFNTTAPHQLRDGYWVADLIPQAISRLEPRYAPLEVFSGMLEKEGFSGLNVTAPLEAILQGPQYLDPKGPFDKEWRDGDSTWALSPKEELDTALARLRKMIADGSIAGFMKEREVLRKKTGQCVFISGRAV